MLFIDSELHPLSPVAELEKWRDKLLEMKSRHPAQEDQQAIDQELARVEEHLQYRSQLDAVDLR